MNTLTEQAKQAEEHAERVRQHIVELVQLLGSYDGHRDVLATVALYLDGNRSVRDARVLGAGLAQCLESEFGSPALAEAMNNAGYADADGDEFLARGERAYAQQLEEEE
jgi:hypothetical protein